VPHGKKAQEGTWVASRSTGQPLANPANSQQRDRTSVLWDKERYSALNLHECGSRLILRSSRKLLRSLPVQADGQHGFSLGEPRQGSQLSPTDPRLLNFRAYTRVRE